MNLPTVSEEECPATVRSERGQLMMLAEQFNETYDTVVELYRRKQNVELVRRSLIARKGSRTRAYRNAHST